MTPGSNFGRIPPAPAIAKSRAAEFEQYPELSQLYYRGLNHYQYYFGVPYYNDSIMGPKTLF